MFENVKQLKAHLKQIICLTLRFSAQLLVNNSY